MVKVEQRGYVEQLLEKRDIKKASPYPSSLSEFSNPIATTPENAVEKPKYLSLVMDIMYTGNVGASSTSPRGPILNHCLLLLISHSASTLRTLLSMLLYLSMLIMIPSLIKWYIGLPFWTWWAALTPRMRVMMMESFVLAAALGFPGAFFVFISSKQSIVTK